MNSHMGKDLVFNKGFSHHEGRNVDILQMGPALDIHIRSEWKLQKRETKARRYLKDHLLAVLLSVYLLVV